MQKNIIILGAGNIGSFLAKTLCKENNVTVIDGDIKKLEKLRQEADIATVKGDGIDWKLLSDLLEKNPDPLFVAMTGNDHSNLVSCSIAKNLGFPTTVARVKDFGFLARSKLDFGKLFSVDHFLGAEVLAAQNILKCVISPSSLAIENFAHGTIQMRSISIPATWTQENVPLSKLKTPHDLLIVLIHRKTNGKEEIIFPHGNDVLLPGDEITLIGETRYMSEIPSLFSLIQKPINSVVIVGGSPVALRLGLILEKMHIPTTLIEQDEKRCNELAELLPNSIILNHDGADLDFLHAEEVYRADAFIACTNEDESNILLALLGKEAGCKKVVALISDTKLSSLLNSLHIAFSVSERVNIANRILAILHKKSFVSIASLYSDQVKVLEIKVSPDCSLINTPLSKLSLPNDMLIAAIEKQGKIMIGKGDSFLSAGDTIIVITKTERLHELQEIF
ncbi:MAG: Trk system potassium transporter TrkA [Chlamydiota bacterium]